MKKSLLLVLVLTLALILSACGGAPAEEPAMEEPAVEEPAAPTEEPAMEERLKHRRRNGRAFQSCDHYAQLYHRLGFQPEHVRCPCGCSS